MTRTSSQGRTVGVVKRKLPGKTKIKASPVSASTAELEYLVESSKTGKKKARKPEALHRTA